MKQLAWLTLLFAAVLLSASFAGYKFSSRVTDPERARYLQSYILSNLQQAKDWDQVRRRAEFWRVLKNNLKVDLVIFGGALTLGFLGFSTLIINGYQIGYLCKFATFMGIPESTYLHYTVPHGVFEIFGFALAQAIATQVAIHLIQYFRGQGLNLNRRLLISSTFSVGLIIFAAWVEVYITPYLH